MFPTLLTDLDCPFAETLEHACTGNCFINAERTGWVLQRWVHT